MTAHHRTRGGQPRLSGPLRCFGAPQASPELVCCTHAAPSPPAACILLWTACRPGDPGWSSRTGCGAGGGSRRAVASAAHQRRRKPRCGAGGESGVTGGGCGSREGEGGLGSEGGGREWHAHSLLGLLLLPLVYLAVHGVLVLVKQRRLITLVVGACARGRRRVERGARAELGAISVPWGARACHGWPGLLHARGCGGRVFSCHLTQRAPVSGAPSRLSVLASAKVNRSPNSSGHKSVFTSRSRCMS